MAFKKKCADAEVVLTEIANGQASVKKVKPGPQKIAEKKIYIDKLYLICI